MIQIFRKLNKKFYKNFINLNLNNYKYNSKNSSKKIYLNNFFTPYTVSFAVSAVSIAGCFYLCHESEESKESKKNKIMEAQLCQYIINQDYNKVKDELEKLKKIVPLNYKYNNALLQAVKKKNEKI